MKHRVNGGGALWMTDGRLPAVEGSAVHARNAATMWSAFARDHGEVLVESDRARIVAPSPFHSLRAIVLDPETEVAETTRELTAELLARTDVERRIVEDPSGRLDLTKHGFTPQFRMPVMWRDPGPVQDAGPAPETLISDPAGTRSGDVPALRGVTVARVGGPDALLAAERIFNAVFPPSRVARVAPADPTDPMRGRTHPASVLGIPGWHTWLGLRDGVPAAAAYSYDDGVSLGVYQVGTLPEHRGHGVGLAVMKSILADRPDLPFTLTATAQGQPLYERLGFEVVSGAVWWTPVHTGDDSGAYLR